MKFTFDLFNGTTSPSSNFIQWLPGWWYYSVGFPLNKGTLSNGDKWLLVGWFLSDENPEDIIVRMRYTSSETLFRADGQFILALFLKDQRSVHIYRDRTGIFPLFYAGGEHGIAFSQWIDNVQNMANFPYNTSDAILHHWPVYRKTFSPHTPFDAIKSLSGKHSLTIKNGCLSENAHPMCFPSG
ncbi:MAG: hypothetical protein JRJ00_10620, partial [Deltaproteobacteria bacterium]|nr:hypothetical protein [Deltaproteobacteria bacterium]